MLNLTAESNIVQIGKKLIQKREKEGGGERTREKEEEGEIKKK